MVQPSLVRYPIYSNANVVLPLKYMRKDPDYYPLWPHFVDVDLNHRKYERCKKLIVALSCKQREDCRLGKVPGNFEVVWPCAVSLQIGLGHNGICFFKNVSLGKLFSTNGTLVSLKGRALIYMWYVDRTIEETVLIFEFEV